MSKKIDRIGEKGVNNFGSEMIIVEYRKSSDIDVYFPEYNSKGYLVKDKNGDYSIDMIPRGYEVHPVVLNVKYCPVCGKKLL